MRVKGLLLSLLLLLVACGGADLTPISTPLPEELQGQWQTAIASFPGIDYTRFIYPSFNLPIDPSGLNIQNSTLGIIFFFYPDGHYQHMWTWRIKEYACTTVLQWWERGTVSLVGSALTLKPSEAKNGMANDCTGVDMHGPAQGKARTLNVKSDQDDTGWPLLLLGYPGGDLTLEKCRECE